MSSYKPLAYFITGTDTGVGKTLIASALIHKLVQQGYKTVGMKPLAAGCELADDGNGGRKLLSEDVAQLISASNVAASLTDINPYAFAAAIAPHIAAQQAGIEIDLEGVRCAYARLMAQADAVIVEGVGGFRVPLNDNLDTADLAKALALPVIMVVGMRLGCLNHALLTAEAIRQRGLYLAGWVANRLDPAMEAYAENLRALQQRLQSPCLGQLPWLEQDADFVTAATYLELPV